MRVDLPFESATIVVRTGRIALAVDTSGSIDESLLRRFAAEVAAVLGELSASCLDLLKKKIQTARRKLTCSVSFRWAVLMFIISLSRQLAES